MFDELFREQGFEHDNVFDWMIREFQRLEPAAQELLAFKIADDRRAADTVQSPDSAIPNVP
jgi:hypothetical protein